MAHLHPERWRELAPEFEARKLLLAAFAALAEAIDTQPVALTRKRIQEALASQHPATRDPAAAEEYEQRAAGTYEPPQGSTGERHRAPAAPDPRIAALEARIKQLEGERAKPEQPPESATVPTPATAKAEKAPK